MVDMIYQGSELRYIAKTDIIVEPPFACLLLGMHENFSVLDITDYWLMSQVQSFTR